MNDRHTFHRGTVAAVIVLWAFEAAPHPALEPGNDAVLQTEEGMILQGVLGPTSGNGVILNTLYGRLEIPLTQIVRVNGDRFEPEAGIIREHSIIIHENGDITLEYLFPVTQRAVDRQLTILAPGAVQSIQDTNGNLLSFAAEQTGRYSRCCVIQPEHRLSAVTIVTRIKSAVINKNNRKEYTYRYTPSTDQTFRLNLTLPADAVEAVADPAPIRAVTQTIQWESKLGRQQTTVYHVSYKQSETD